MSQNHSFVAMPIKRYYAFVADAVATLLAFMIIGVLGEVTGMDMARWDVFALVYFIYQGAFLAFRGDQTFGRYLAGISVVGADGSQLRVVQACLRSMVRALPLSLFEGTHLFPFLGSVLLLVLVIADTRLIERTPTRQSVADRLVKTLVVNLPPPHTHRAPAGPMYSASDAEFGLPPRGPLPK